MSFNTGQINLNDPKELGEFNLYLSTRSYVNGFTPSNEDVLAFKNFTSAPNPKFIHILRWYNHIASFSDKERSTWPKQNASGVDAKDNEDFDLFGEDSETDEEKERVTQERLKAYADKKAKKPALIAKSNIIYDIKPWDDTIKPADIEKKVREIQTDGLVWGSSKALPVAFGIQKLQICCVIEDEKVSSDWLEEQITNIEDLVQSVDIVAFNKV